MSYVSEQTYAAGNQALETRLVQLETVPDDLLGKVDKRFREQTTQLAEASAQILLMADQIDRTIQDIKTHGEFESQ